jgi:predicted CopG family antitoxin
MFMAMFMVKKTTVLLREDVYQALKEKAGAKNVSNLINQIIIEHFAKERSMFGTMKKVDTSDLRDHRDRA